MNIDKIIKEASDNYNDELLEPIPSAEKVAESYVNGNISWVKEQVKDNKQLQKDVFDYILQVYTPEIGNDFIRNIVLG